MILQPGQRKLILAGRKTQLRVPVLESRTITRKNGTTYESQPFTPKAGMRIPIARRDPDGVVEEVCGVIVREARHQLLGNVTFHDALAEGHRTTVEFKAWWIRTHAPGWLQTTERAFCPGCILDTDWPGDQAPTCETCGGEEEIDLIPSRTDEELAARYDLRHGDMAVWAVTFVLDREQKPLMLAPFGRGDDHGYTSSPTQALHGEGEVVDQATVAAFAQENRERYELTTASERLRERARTLGRRIREETIATGRAGVDVTAELDAIEAQLRTIEFRRREAQRRAA